MLLLPAVLSCMCMGANGWNIKSHLSTMTPYKYSVNGANTTYTIPENCEQVYIDAVFRHGSRYPTSRPIKSIANLEQLLHTFNDSLKLPWMKTWKNPFNIADEGRLSELGLQEHYGLGARYVEKFKSLLSPYNPNRIFFTSTYKTRTGQSGASFCDGMTGKTIPVAMTSESKGMDRKLRFYDECPRYTKEVEENPSVYEETSKYFSLHVNEIAQRFSNVTGIPAASITSEVLSNIWSACQSEVAAFDDGDHWCSIFSPLDIEIFEYAYDLDAYYTRGYGHEINYQIASPLLSEIMTSINMNAAINIFDNSDIVTPKAQLRFGHAETTMPLLALLGLYKDSKKLTSEWSYDDIVKRKWRTSNISSLATNVAFVLYKCRDSNMTLEKKPYVELLHDENIVYLPECGNKRLCPLAKFNEIYDERAKLDWVEICKNGSNGSSPSWLAMVAAALMMMMFQFF